MATALKLVKLSNPHQVVNGLQRAEYVATDPLTQAFLKFVAQLNTTWNVAIPKIEDFIKNDKKNNPSGRPVALLKGSYVRQSKGVVTGVSPVKLPGYIYLQRKGYDAATNTLYIWVVVK